MILITITSPEEDPSKIMDSFLHENNKTTEFIPALSFEQADKKRKDKILWYQEKIASASETEFDYKKQLDQLKEMSTYDYVRDEYGFSEFRPETNQFGYIGNRNARISSYSLGDPVFIDFKGGKLSQAKMKEIDWNKMSEEALLNAKNEAGKWNKANDTGFIAIRQKVHMRPQVMINKDKRWCDEESFNNIDGHKSIEIFQNEWEKSLKNASPDDVFTHWMYQQ